MQSFAVNYIPSGSLIILLTQSAIPISMVISRPLVNAKYTIQHYLGATIVVAGLIVVLVPTFIGHSAQNANGESNFQIAIWCMILILSCIPMTLSSVYKEKSLGISKSLP
jgi:drug/metabolite transporter (DMT)-like permease